MNAGLTQSELNKTSSSCSNLPPLANARARFLLLPQESEREKQREFRDILEQVDSHVGPYQALFCTSIKCSEALSMPGPLPSHQDLR